MNGIPLLVRRTIRIGRPVEVVFQQIFELGEEVLAGAAREAIRSAGVDARRPLRPSSYRRAPAPLLAIEVAEPVSARGCLMLPLRWRVSLHPLLSDVHCTLETRPVGPRDVEVEVRLLHRPVRGMPDAVTREQAQAFLQSVVESFSRRVFWAIEARQQYELGPRGARYDSVAPSSVQENA